MHNKVHRKSWIGLILLTLVFCSSGWLFRHSIMGAVHALTLPELEPPPAGTIRFAVIGDYGQGGPSERDVAQLVDSWEPDFVATVGDNNYPDGAAETIDKNIGKFYHSYISPYKGSYGAGADKNHFFPIPGHVDWDNAALQPYLDYFTLPGNERYYDVVWGPVHLFMVDTDEREPDGATSTSPQARWLEKSLSDSNAPWKLVFTHHAPYTSHCYPDTPRMRWPFKAWGADAVLSGFYHIYERLLVDGLPYFIDGVGGSWFSNFCEIDNNSQFRYNEDFGAMMVEASDTRISFRFINRSGRLVDEYVMVKERVGKQ